MKLLLLSITLVCVSNAIAAQHDKREEAINSNEKPQMDEAKADTAKNEDNVGVRNSIQPEQPLAQPMAQSMYVQPNRNYPNQNYYNQPYYPSQSYNPYQYQQRTWNAPVQRPLMGNKYWEYPNLRARMQNRYWNNQPQQPYYYGRNQNQQWNYQSQWAANTKPATVPQIIKPFDSTSEKYYQSEYNYGSVQPTNLGIELIPSEFEKSPPVKRLDCQEQGLGIITIQENLHGKCNNLSFNPKCIIHHSSNETKDLILSPNQTQHTICKIGPQPEHVVTKIADVDADMETFSATGTQTAEVWDVKQSVRGKIITVNTGVPHHPGTHFQTHSQYHKIFP